MSYEFDSDPNAAPEPLLTRRALLQGSIVVGAVAVGVGGGLLIAGWPLGDDDDDDDDDIAAVDDDEDEELTPEDEEEATPTPEPTPQETPTPEATPTPDPTPTPVPIPDEPVGGGKMVIASSADPWSLHPNADETTANWLVITQIHDALMEVDHDFEVVPRLAERFEAADDASSFGFELRQGVLFHNGEEMTADDVVYTHEWHRDPENGGARSFYYERVESIEAPDEYTVIFRMSAPDATFFRRAASTYILNREYHEQVTADGHSLDPIGTGPFVLRDWIRGESISLESFEDYFDGPPYLDGIQIQIIPDASDRLSSLQDGTVDAVFGLPTSDSLGIVEDGDVTTVEVTDLDCNHIALNNEHPILSDRNVRLAMLYAFERPPLIDAVYQGAATAATSFLSPALTPWHHATIEETTHLPDRAIELLEESGWVEGEDGIRERDGERLSFTCKVPDGGDPRAQGAEMISEMLAEVGIEMNLEEAPTSESLEQMRAGEIDAALFNWTYGGWRGEPDARTTLLTGAFNNFSRFSSAQVDHFLVQGISESDESNRQAIYRQIQDIIADRLPFVYIMFPHSFYHFSPRLQGVPETAGWGSRLFRLTREFWIFE
jgi:peptide/nickel transport system substrate-binding protein